MISSSFSKSSGAAATGQFNHARHKRVLTSILLFCGLLSSLFYVFQCSFVAAAYPGYSSASQTVSELSSVGAPTRELWVTLGVVYTLLVMAFGWGLLRLAYVHHRLRTAGIAMVLYAALGALWPFFPMHQRTVLAAGGGTASDTGHLVLGAVTVVLMMVVLISASRAFGKTFRLYSLASALLMLVFGAATALQAPRLERNEPTPMIGVWERVSIGVFLLWVVVQALILLRRQAAKPGATEAHSQKSSGQ